MAGEPIDAREAPFFYMVTFTVVAADLPGHAY